MSLNVAGGLALELEVDAARLIGLPVVVVRDAVVVPHSVEKAGPTFCALIIR